MDLDFDSNKLVLNSARALMAIMPGQLPGLII